MSDEVLKQMADVLAGNQKTLYQMIQRLLEQNQASVDRLLTELLKRSSHQMACKVCQAEQVLSDQEKKPIPLDPGVGVTLDRG